MASSSSVVASGSGSTPQIEDQPECSTSRTGTGGPHRHCHNRKKRRFQDCVEMRQETTPKSQKVMFNVNPKKRIPNPSKGKKVLRKSKMKLDFWEDSSSSVSSAYSSNDDHDFDSEYEDDDDDDLDIHKIPNVVDNNEKLKIQIVKQYRGVGRVVKDEYYMKRIEDFKIDEDNNPAYLIRWMYWPSGFNSWVKERKLNHALDFIYNYFKLNPNKLILRRQFKPSIENKLAQFRKKPKKKCVRKRIAADRPRTALVKVKPPTPRLKTVTASVPKNPKPKHSASTSNTSHVNTTNTTVAVAVKDPKNFGKQSKFFYRNSSDSSEEEDFAASLAAARANCSLAVSISYDYVEMVGIPDRAHQFIRPPTPEQLVPKKIMNINNKFVKPAYFICWSYNSTLAYMYVDEFQKKFPNFKVPENIETIDR